MHNVVSETCREGRVWRGAGLALLTVVEVAALGPAPAAAGTPKTVVDFAAPSPGQPLQGLIAGTDGAYYGVEFGTVSLSGPGTPFPSVFRLTPKGPGKNGWQAAPIAVGNAGALALPIAYLTAGPGGVLYGSATLDGCIVWAPGFTFPCEAVVSLTPPAAGQATWTANVLWHTAAGTMITGLALAPSGVLIGSATDNTVFELTPPAAGQPVWSPATLYTFTGGADGGFPTGRLLLDSDGNIYGAAYQGGALVCGTAGTAACGTVFRLSPPANSSTAWSETTLYSGTAGPVELSYLQGGALYGVDQAGCCGAVVKIAPGPAALPWVLTDLAVFAGGTDGAAPAGLIAAGGGPLFGTTASGGLASCVAPPGSPTTTGGCGVVFELKPTAKGYRKITLWPFTGGADGGGPFGGLTVGPPGELLGVTYFGGIEALGTVYRLPVPLP